MSDSLFICRQNQSEFDRTKVMGFFSDFPEISERSFSESEKVDLRVSFSFKGRGFLANLAKDRLAVVIEEVSALTLELAWQLQTFLSESLFVFDESYSFQFSLSNFSAVNDLIDAYRSVGRTT